MKTVVLKSMFSMMILYAASLLLGCNPGADTDEFDEVEQTAEAASAVVLYGNYCEDGVCITYKLECNVNNECVFTIIEIHDQEEPLGP